MRAPLELRDVMNDRAKLRQADFVARYPHPILLGRSQRTTDPHTDEESTLLSVPRSIPPPSQSGLSLHPGMIVLEVCKRPGSLFPDIISVGRARNSDLRIDSERVSKFHAYFAVNEEQSIYRLADAASKNGTFVNGTQLEPKNPVTLSDGALVSFSTHVFRFHLPEPLYELLGADGG